MTWLAWSLAVILIVLGVIGTVLPVLPGTVLIFAGILLAAWVGDFTVISTWAVGLAAVLTLISIVADYLAAVLGAKRYGASREAMVGAAIGTVVGIFTGLWGLLFMPLLGAAIGEFMVIQDLRRAGQVGIGTWAGLLIGTAVKIAIAFALVGIFVASILL
jgi:uncharacterized protein